MSVHQPELRALIVGAGPAGFFTLDELQKLATKQGRTLTVDMVNRDIRPGGLVVYGVAPDHGKIRSIKDQFEAQLNLPGVRYYGNVSFASDLLAEDLQDRYHIVVFAVGAQSDTDLGIPGEDLKGCYSGREFIGWYNGDPNFTDLNPNLENSSVALIGAGNVAADIARVLLRPIGQLHETDISATALQSLESSKVQEVIICVRRSPAFVKFSPVELRALGEIDGVDVCIDERDLQLDPESAEFLTKDKDAAKNYAMFKDLAAKFSPANRSAAKRIVFKFLVSPQRILGSSCVERVVLQMNRLENGKLVPAINSEKELQVGMVIKSVGYKVIPIPGLPYDKSRAVIFNTGGRISLAEDLPRQYVVGWAADGATGIIGTNKTRAKKVVSSIAEDLLSGAFDKCLPPSSRLEELLADRRVNFVSLQDWKVIDEKERALGISLGRPRFRFQTKEEMLTLLDATRKT